MKVVLIAGIFNVIHPGHIRLFNFAKKCGDRLIVAIQPNQEDGIQYVTDDSLRLEMVASSALVDEAFLTNQTIESLVDELRPDFVIKGREHEKMFNPEKQLLQSYGGELLFAPGDTSPIIALSVENSLKLPKEYMKRHQITLSNLSQQVKKISELRVTVIGDLIMDEYIDCKALGMSQEDPTIVVSPKESQLFVGGAGIVASHAASLGAKVNFISVTGSDLNRNKAEKILNEENMHTSLMLDKHRQTTLKQRFRCEGKTLFRVSHLDESDISQILQESLIEAFEKIAGETDLLVFSDFNYGVLSDKVIHKITDIAKKHKVYIAADSQSSSQVGDISRYKDSDLINATEREARLAMQDHNSGLVVLADELRKSTNATNVLLKLGAEGVLINAGKIKNSEFFTDRIDALNKNPRDVAGAGDSMLIVASMILCLGGTIWDATLLGSIAAGLQVGNIGNEPMKLQRILNSIES